MIKRLFSLFIAIVMMTTVVCSNPVSTYASAGYTVEFTYSDLQYVLQGDSRVELSKILDTVGIEVNGEITEVIGSNDSLFKPVNEDGTWYIEAVTAFTSTEWLKVKIGEAEFEIVVTDGVSGSLTNPIGGSNYPENIVRIYYIYQNTVFYRPDYERCYYSVDNLTPKDIAELKYGGTSIGGNKLYYTHADTYKPEGAMNPGTCYHFLSLTEYTVSYNLDGGTGTSFGTTHFGKLSNGNIVQDDAQQAVASYTYTVPSTKPTREKYIFLGWKDGNGVSYAPGSTITINSSTARNYVLTAEWERDVYTVSFDTSGGSSVDSQDVKKGETAETPESLTKADNKFLGWTADSEPTTSSALFDFDTAITDDITVYAIWEEHTNHVWAYAADGNKLCAYCTVDGYNCSYYGTESDLSKAIKLELNAPAARSGALAYDGNDYIATITDTGNKWSTTFSLLPGIEYEYKKFGMEAASYSSVTDTKDAGYYKASTTAGDATAYIEYQIAKKTVTLSVTMENYEVNASQPPYPSAGGGPDGATYNFTFKRKGADDSTYSEEVPTTPWGDYTVKATYAGDENHDSATATYDFKITPKERPETISVTMSGYKYGQDTAPTPFITPAASELAENPTVTYKYGLDGSQFENPQLWTGDTSALGAHTTYEMRAVIGATDSYEEYITDPMAFYVEKGEWKVTAPTAKIGLTYNCVGQNLVDAGSTVGNGKFLYSIDGTNYSESIPQAIDAGTHKVYYKVESDGNHVEYRCDAPIEVTIAKEDWNVTAPTAIAPSFTGSAQALINAGVVKDADDSTVANKMLYSLTGNDDYSTTIPTATEVGSYTVYYKVNGDDNHNGYAVKTVTATIEKISRTDMPTVSMDGYTYGQTGSISTPALSATPSESPAVTYYYNDTDAIDGAEKWENITSTTLDAGTYYMFACIGETASYRECYTEFKQFIIAKADCTDITAPAGLTLKYNGQPQALVSAGSSAQGTMKYSLTGSEGDFSTEIPTGTTIGTYIVYYKVAGDENHNDSAPDSLTVTIGKGIHNVTAPTALSLKENGSAQVLILAGSCTTGTLLYSLDDIEYSDSIEGITASAIGTYTVYYKVEGDANYEAFGPKTLTAKIVEKSGPISILPSATPVPEEIPDKEKTEGSVEETEEYTAPTVEYDEQIENGEASVPVKAEINDGIAAVEEITEDTLKDIPDEILSETTALTIDLSWAAQDVTGVDLTTKTLEAVVDVISDDSNVIESVKFELSDAIVELDAKTLEAVLESVEGNTVRLVVENTEEESLNKSQSITLKDYDVDRTFEVYFESAGKRIHDFKGGKTLVSLSFKPEKGKRVENYKVFYIGDNGKLQKMTTKYEDGLITFVTGHFSDYAIVYENVKEVLIAEPSMTSKGNIKLNWNKITGAVKYMVYGAKCGTSYKLLAELDAETDGNSLIVKKINGAALISGKTYKFVVVAYDALGNKLKSKTVHFIAGNASEKYGNVETITALQKTVELTVGEKATVGAEYTMYEDKKHTPKKHGKALRFTSDCPDVAKVSKDGTVTAKSEGKAVIYVQDISGKWCTVEVTVKEK